jgi:hypothetical protein
MAKVKVTKIKALSKKTSVRKERFSLGLVKLVVAMN